MRKALLILSDTRGLSTFPAVYQCANELKARRFHVSIVTGSLCDDDKISEFFDEIIALRCSSIFEYSWKYALMILKDDYEYVLCFEPRDAIYVAITSLINKKPKYIYYNLEIHELLSDKLIHKIKFRITKTLEKVYGSACMCIIIQDPIRAKMLAKHGIKNKATYFIPNSYYTFFAHTNNDRICDGTVFYSGGLEEWSISQIAQHADLYNDINFTFSGWSRDQYLDKVRDVLNRRRNIKFFEQKLSIEDYVKFVQKHDIGLVWYSTTCDNVTYIGRSSGKFFMYLSCGLPVIVQNLPGMAEDVIKYELGIVINSISELHGAVRAIVNDYQFYKNNVENSYVKQFDYGVVSKGFFDNL